MQMLHRRWRSFEREKKRKKEDMDGGGILSSFNMQVQTGSFQFQKQKWGEWMNP